MSPHHLLVVEDEDRVADFLARGLRADGYVVTVARTGPEGLELGRTGAFAAIVLDLMLPGLPGQDVCQSLRAAGDITPILMLTALDAVVDRVEGLRMGADDYMTKPFAMDELLARLEALLRRGRDGESAPAASPSVLEVGDLRLDHGSKAAWRGERRLDLTAKEFALLAYLMANADIVVSRAKLLSNVWGLSFDPGTKLVDVYIRYLRRKVDGGEARPLIHTPRGFGYKVSAEVAAPE